jgi:endonuclease V-like protein UPF0215 family
MEELKQHIGKNVCRMQRRIAMFEMVCEVTRMATRNNYLKKRGNYIKKANRVVEVRPIERSRKIPDDEAIFEKYDERGETIHQSPLKHSICDERA